MDILKFYLVGGETISIPSAPDFSYKISSFIRDTSHNLTLSVIHKADNVILSLRDLFLTQLKDKEVSKVEWRLEDVFLDTIEGNNISVYWALNKDIYMAEQVFNEAISVEVS